MIKEKEEDSELDSLDGYLYEFRERSVEASRIVLPTHNGLGSFRIDETAIGEEV